MSGNVRILDTFADFMEAWEALKHCEIADMPDVWEKEYMKRYPDLLLKQTQQYASEGLDWRKVSKQHVFQDISERIGRIQTAHASILDVAPAVLKKLTTVFEFTEEIWLVIYVGIGCGAGWATSLQGRPAVLLGLENIAECNWESKESITGLLSHEIGHLYHANKRSKACVPRGYGPFWRLYEEGFAQRFEHLLSGADTWHEMSGINGEDWLDWCKGNISELVRVYLQRVFSGQSVDDFFGHWFDIEGRKQCGYFIGHEFIRYLEEKGLTIEQIALIPEIEGECHEFLMNMASQERLGHSAYQHDS